MINSGHTAEESKRLIVKGVAKYLYLRECSEKSQENHEYKPFYLCKEFHESDRQVAKYMAKMGWYRCKENNTPTLDCPVMSMEREELSRACPAKSPVLHGIDEPEPNCIYNKPRACPAKSFQLHGVDEPEPSYTYSKSRACPAKSPQLQYREEPEPDRIQYNPRACPAKSPEVQCTDGSNPGQVLHKPRACPAKLPRLGSDSNNKKDISAVRKEKEGWKKRLVGVWGSGSNSQRNVEGMQFSSILQVASSKGGRLIKKLVEAESSLAELSGYNVKIVEKSGTQLSRLFKRVFTNKNCHWGECPACMYSDDKVPSKCRINNIVYEAVCIECEDMAKEGIINEKKIGRYIGESSRTLAERSKEHIEGATNIDSDNFIVKHWVSCHSELESIPRIRFKMLKSFQDVLSRLATEAVLIDNLATMNSKSEFRCNKLARIVIVDPRSGRNKDEERQSAEENIIMEKIEDLKKRKGTTDKKTKGSSVDDKEFGAPKKKTPPRPVKSIMSKRTSTDPYLQDKPAKTKRRRLAPDYELNCENPVIEKDLLSREKERKQDEVSNKCCENLIVEQAYNLGKLSSGSKQVVEQEEASASLRLSTPLQQPKCVDEVGKKNKHQGKKLKQRKIEDCLVNVVKLKNSTYGDVSPTNQALCCRSLVKQSSAEERMTPVNSTKTDSESVETVGEQRRDFVGSIALACSPNTQSTSKGCKAMKSVKERNRTTKKPQHCIPSSDEDERKKDTKSARGPRGRTGKVTRKGVKTSTPVTVKKEEMKIKGRQGKKHTRTIGRGRKSLDEVKKRLDEGLLVNLSSSSDEEENVFPEFESTGSSLREAIDNGDLIEINVAGSRQIKNKESEKGDISEEHSCEKRACPAKYDLNRSTETRRRHSSLPKRACPAKYNDHVKSPENGKRSSSLPKRACPAKYNDHVRSSEVAWRSQTLPKRACPAKYNEMKTTNNERDCPAEEVSEIDCSWKDSSDPVIESVIMSLTEREAMFSNPFELADHIREALVNQAEQSGSRALSWTLGDFDRIGGKNTLRTIWDNLKFERRVIGVKRKMSDNGEEEESKRLCRSLDLSGTCGRLSEIQLRSDSSETLSEECSKLRESSLSGSEVNVSLLLEETDNREEVERILEEAEDLLEEVRAEFPGLTSSSESVYDSDSGNSEARWGSNRVSLGLVRTFGGVNV